MIDAELLLLKYKEGRCTPEEIDLLHAWFHELNLTNKTNLVEVELLESSRNCKVPEMAKSSISWTKLIAAAVLIMVCSVAYYVILQNKSEHNIQVLVENAVVLELEDGRQINLQDSTKGLLDELSGLQIIKSANGRLQYSFNSAESKESKKSEYHTLKTPVGEVVDVILEDGTSVVLNAQSTLRFPSTFAGANKREVELLGEAYFIVATSFINKEPIPFSVRSRGQKVEVLGTAFNIHAFANENTVKTTLAHGAVRISLENGSDEIILNRIGDQAVVRNNEVSKREVILENELAWRNGKLAFQDQDIYSIMRSIARFYPIEVEYQEDFKGALFGGVISKGKSLEDMLKLVEETGEVKFIISPREGDHNERRVVVMK